MKPLLPADPCRCPLCGGPNHCAMEQVQASHAQAPCWCTRAQFSAQLLQQVPEPARGKACICQACVQASQAPS
ncbi:MAG: cysteine-rich CWC family protein [Limnohabitans sp.]